MENILNKFCKIDRLISHFTSFLSWTLLNYLIHCARVIFAFTKKINNWIIFFPWNYTNLVAFAGPHSPLAQSGKGTITVCRSSQTILNLQTLLNFIGSPVKYSWGVTALAKISRSRALAEGAWTRKATTLPTTDCKNIMMIFSISRKNNKLLFFLVKIIFSKNYKINEEQWTQMILELAVSVIFQ